jgi:hypothetical protein
LAVVRKLAVIVTMNWWVKDHNGPVKIRGEEDGEDVVVELIT